MENLKFPRDYFLFSTWRRNDSSEVSFDSSEVLFLAYVEIFYLPRGDLRISTWGSAFFVAKRFGHKRFCSECASEWNMLKAAYFALSSYFSRFALESIGRIQRTEPPK